MKNKINGKPYPYMSLRQFLKYNLEGLNNTYSRQKEKAFYAQCHYAKHKKQDNRYKMNLNFRICSEYKKEIQIVNQWIKEIEKIEQVKKENEQLKAQLEKRKCCLNCRWFLLRLECEIYKPYCCENDKYLQTEKVCKKWEVEE